MKTQHAPKFFLHTSLIILLLSLLLVVSQHAVRPASAGGVNETEVTLAAGVVTITDINGGSSNDKLTLSYAGGTYTLNDSGGLAIDVSSIAGSTGSGSNNVTFPDTGVTGITFDLLGGDDTISVNSVQASFSDNFTVMSGTGLDSATINADIATTGSGAVNITTTGNILLNSGASLTTVDGGIMLTANEAGTQSASFSGITALNTVIQTTGTGDIQLLGKGAGNNNTTSYRYGIALYTGTSVSSTAAGAAAGKITITGTGAEGPDGEVGVYMGQTTTDVTSVDGDIEITGIGGNGSGDGNVGVSLNSIETIQSTGTGATAAKITIHGTSGTGNSYNEGVYIYGNTTDVTSVDGDIQITGISNGANSRNDGVALRDMDKIASTGTNLDAATITINGENSGNNNSYGLYFFTFDIFSAAGAIQLTGTSSPVGSPFLNDGIRINDGTIQVTNGPLNLDGVCIGGDSSGIGLSFANLISVGGGHILMNADGGDSGNGYNDFSGFSNVSIGGVTHTGDIFINADSVNIDGTSIDSDGALTVQPKTPGTTIGLGSSYVGVDRLDLNDTELSNLQDGFSSITIGNSDAGDITVESAIFKDPLILLTAGNIHNTFGTSITNIGNNTTFDGTLAPGLSPGTFSVNGDVSFADDSSFAVELTGATTTGPHDKLTATGGVTIGSNVSLNLDTSGYTTHQTGVITLIQNGNGAVNGTFNGLPEGAETNNGGSPNFIISYVGGDGNDVTLTATTPTTLTLARFGTTASGATTNGLFWVIAGGLGLFSLLVVWRRRQESTNGS
ncbi:MAG: hypothetical protein KDE48_03745 [Anaerolineales bacterium]|nr:hypothetical protein [Anaerolineales bacterium]